jgi:hypothetical protein
MLKLPGGVEAMLYEPRHLTAIGLPGPAHRAPVTEGPRVAG